MEKMRQWLWVFIGFFMWSCNDGDLEVSEIDFDAVALTSCTADLETTAFFKLKGDESLILVLQDGILQNVPGEIALDIPLQSQFYYRFFDSTVSLAYFCNEIPPATPLVKKEMEATEGTLRITTVEEDLGAGILEYHHTFVIENLILTNTNGEQLIDTNFELGMFTTTN
ncbi:MAG: hypothetical protein KDD04_12000 [Sinomicrobium sp.]|nr:hypothetical protein [Sinomicrobium sp.]